MESYFNETLTLNFFTGKYSSREMLENRILGTNMSFHEKNRNVFVVYDKEHKGIDTNGDTYRDLVALGSLRNRIVHYMPEWGNIYSYPRELEHIITMTNLSLENAGWIVNFSNIAIGLWAKLTVKNTLTDFSTITGAVDSFTNKEELRSFIWVD